MKGNPQCSQDNCGSSINYVMCSMTSMWKQVYDFQISYTVICLLVAFTAAVLSFSVNKIDVEKGEIGSG